MSGFVENQYAALPVTLSPKSVKIHIKAAAKILKGQLDRITSLVGIFVDGARESFGCIVRTFEDIKNSLDYALSFLTGYIFPRMHAT